MLSSRTKLELLVSRGYLGGVFCNCSYKNYIIYYFIPSEIFRETVSRVTGGMKVKADRDEVRDVVACSIDLEQISSWD